MEVRRGGEGGRKVTVPLYYYLLFSLPIPGKREEKKEETVGFETSKGERDKDLVLHYGFRPNRPHGPQKEKRRKKGGKEKKRGNTQAECSEAPCMTVSVHVARPTEGEGKKREETGGRLLREESF